MIASKKLIHFTGTNYEKSDQNSAVRALPTVLRQSGTGDDFRAKSDANGHSNGRCCQGYCILSLHQIGKSDLAESSTIRISDAKAGLRLFLSVRE